ncbi:hypothetical protein ACWDNR_16600, partial [Gordonia aichiensis]
FAVAVAADHRAPAFELCARLVDEVKAKVYMTAGTGLPGSHERLSDPGIDGDGFALGNQVLLGGAIEFGIDQCTRQMAARLAELGIPAKVTLRPGGTHSWGYWQDDLHQTWPSIARDIGA